MDNIKNHRFDYMHLLDRFNTSVAENLRSTGFSDADLSLWVPDPDPVRSLTGFVHAVCQEAGNTVELTLPSTLLTEHDRDSLRRATAQEANLNWRVSEAETILIVSARASEPKSSAPNEGAGRLIDRANDRAPATSQIVKGKENADSVLPDAWRSYLSDRAKYPSDTFENYRKTDWIAKHSDGCWLAVKCDSAGTITETAYGILDNNSLLDGLLAVLCNICHGKPPLEMVAHGLGHVVELCRSERPDADLPGIVVPVSFGPEFSEVSRLLRLFRENGVETAVEYDEPPTQVWLSLDDGQRKDRLADAIIQFGKFEKLATDDVMLLGLHDDISGWPNRVFVQCSSGIPAEGRPDLLRRLEWFLKENVERKLYVLYETAKDANRLRQL